MVTDTAVTTTSTSAAAVNTVNEEVVSPAASKPAAEKRRTIAIAVDQSPFSDYAFNWACDNLIRDSDEIVILNVRPYPRIAASYLYIDGADPSPYHNTDSTIEKFHKESSHELIRSYSSRVPKDLNLHVRGIALCGDAREEIAFKAEELHADILVVGSRGQGAFKRAMFGSVSDYLLHHCHIPVIVPRMPSTNAQ